MKCPYCIEEVNDAALACSHCMRDLHLLKSMQARIDALESELASVKAHCGFATESQDVHCVVEMQEPQPVSASGPDTYWLWLAPLALLLAAHYLITIILDTNLIWLRLVSLLIPLPFGYLLMSGHLRRFSYALLMAFLVACVTVVSMSAVVHLVDGSSIFPQDGHGWREFIEYAASITCSFATGMMLGRMAWQRKQKARQDRALLSALVKQMMGSDTNMKKIIMVVSSIRIVTAVGTSVASMYTGLHNFL